MDTPFSDLIAALQATTALSGYATVLLGRKKLPMTGAKPKRIVIFPVTATMKAPADRRSLTDEMPVLAAHIWGVDYDDVQDLTARLFQALEQQAAGDETGGGFSWKYDPGTVEWETKADASEQGESKIVQFSIVLSLDRAQLGTGTVHKVQIEGEPDVGTLEFYISSIAVTPAAPTLAPTETQQMSAIATYNTVHADEDVTAVCTWSSSDEDVATVDADGVVTAVATGSADITATRLSASGTATVTVS